MKERPATTRLWSCPEACFARMLGRYLPLAAIGNDYLVLGTMEKKAWREGLTQPKPVEELRAHMHDFKTYYRELRITQPGWYKDDQELPIMEPPPSREWVKEK